MQTLKNSQVAQIPKEIKSSCRTHFAKHVQIEIRIKENHRPISPSIVFRKGNEGYNI